MSIEFGRGIGNAGQSVAPVGVAPSAPDSLSFIWACAHSLSKRPHLARTLTLAAAVVVATGIVRMALDQTPVAVVAFEEP